MKFLEPRALWIACVAGALSLIAINLSAVHSSAVNPSAVVAVPQDLPAGFEKLSEEVGWGGYPTRIRHVATGIVLLLIEPGEFTQGSPESEKGREKDEAQRVVRIESGFYLGETEVTVAQWARVMEALPNELEFEGDESLPVHGVSWNMAKDFVKVLNGAEEVGWRLPTESEWEYACRAETRTPFSFGENVTPSQVNFDGSRPYPGEEPGLRRNKPVPVRSLPANAWGLYEMHGNVWEWCEDPYFIDPAQDTAVELGASRVLRGGSWASEGRKVRSAHRDGYPPSATDAVYGLRVALTISE